MHDSMVAISFEVPRIGCRSRHPAALLETSVDRSARTSPYIGLSSCLHSCTHGNRVEKTERTSSSLGCHESSCARSSPTACKTFLVRSLSFHQRSVAWCLPSIATVLRPSCVGARRSPYHSPFTCE